jgi:gamma-glutamyltranspeptidase/glutathione hydrolase
MKLHLSALASILSTLSLSCAAYAIDQLPPMATSKRGMVVTCQPLAANVGLDVLKSGGNAADAFVAATVAEYVTAFGYTSLSGPLYALYFDAKSGKTSYLNAGLNTVADPAGQWNDEQKIPGTSYVIGGAGRGLEALFMRFGSSGRPFKTLIAPSVNLAKTGFSITPSFARAIQSRLPILKGSKAWMSLFAKDGKPLAEGETFVQPELAETLTHFGEEGADFLFKGKFAQNLVNVIRAQGGKVTLQDLANYQIQWSEPLESKYRGLTIQTSSYRSYGGFELLLDLKTIEHFQGLSKQAHFSKERDAFEKILRTFLFSKHEVFPLMAFANHKDDRNQLRQLLEGSISDEIWSKVTDPKKQAPFPSDTGNHSCSPVVIDKDGNIAAGVHTINSLPWGDFGLIADGVSLNSAHSVALDAPPGERAIDGLNPVLVLKDGKPVFAASFFSSGLHPAAFQTLLNLIDYGMTPQQAIGAPRFGPPTSYNPATLPLDSRYPKDWIAEFAKQGIQLSQPSGFIDTGMAMAISIDPTTGVRTGSPTDLLPFAVSIGE